MNNGKSNEFYCVEIDNLGRNLISERKAHVMTLVKLGRTIPAETLRWCQDLTITSEFILSSGQRSNISEFKWLSVTFLKDGQISQMLRNILQDKNAKYHHIVGIAAPIKEDENYQSDEGHIFCFQPLPQEIKCATGLPVHINAFFDLSQNRRHIKWPDQGENIYDRSVEWNKAIQSELLPHAYCHLLEKMVQLCQFKGNPTYLVRAVYNLIPDWRLVTERWRELTKLFIDLIRNLDVLFSTKDGGKWINIQTATIATSSNKRNSCWKTVEEILRIDNVALVDIPDHVINTFDTLGIQNSKVNPVFVCKHMKQFDTYKTLTLDQKEDLLEYLTVDSAFENVRGLELMRLEDDIFIEFGAGPAVLLEDRYVCNLFSNQHSKFVSTKLKPTSWKRLNDIIEHGLFQVRRLCSKTFAELIEVELSYHFGRHRPIWLSCKNFEMWNDWIKNVWLVIQAKFKDDIACFCHLSIFPLVKDSNWSIVKECHLLRMTDHLLYIGLRGKLQSIMHTITKVFDHFAVRGRSQISMDELNQAFMLLSVYVVNATPTWMEQSYIQPYLYRDTDESLLGLFETLTMSDIRNFNSVATPAQRQSLLTYLGEKMCDSDITTTVRNTLGLLKIFPAYALVDSECTLMVSLQENMNVYIDEYFPVVFPFPYIRLQSQSVKTFARNLGASLLENIAVVETALQNIEKYSFDDKRCLMFWILENFDISKQSKMLYLSRNISFLVNENGIICRPCDLFDPSDNVLQKMFMLEQVFPIEIQQGSKNMYHELAKLGLKTRKNVSSQNVTTTCQIIDQMSTGKQKFYPEKVHALLKFLNENPGLMNVTQISHLKFILLEKDDVSNYPKHIYCKTRDSGSILCSPLEVKSSIYKSLIGSVSYLINTRKLLNLAQIFLWQEEPGVELVVDHIEIVIKSYQQKHGPEFLFEIYEWLARQNIEHVRQALQRNFYFQNNAFIWTGAGFTSSCNVIIEENDNDLMLKPFIHTLPQQLMTHKQFFVDLGCILNVDFDTYVDVLEKIKIASEDVGNNISAASLRGLAISILKKLKEEYYNDVLESSREIYLPVQTDDDTMIIMKPANECIYCDSVWLRDMGCFNNEISQWYIHPDVTNAIAEAFGVPSLTKLMLSETQAFQEWGQEEPLTRRIRNILKEGYVDGFSVIKELFQNADDGRAKKLWIMYDQRENMNARTNLINEGMAEWQGPALWVYNDAEFTEDDLKNITKLSGYTKEDDAAKIGKFGLGFCSVYNITDVPSFVSGTNMVIFDPHSTFLSNSPRAKSPGLRINFEYFANVQMMRQLQNQFLPFQDVFGCNLLSNSKPYFKGTLFRLPLRRKVSEISDHVYAQEDVYALIEKVKELSANLFIFNQSVQELKLFFLKADVISPKNYELLFQIRKMVKFSKELKQHVVLSNAEEPITLQATKRKQLQSLDRNPLTILEHISIKTEETSHGNVESHKVSWFVSWSTGLDKRTLSMTYAEKGYLPLSAIALPVVVLKKELASDEFKVLKLSELPTRFYTVGHFFCFLPLPIEHDFPFHIHSQFNLSSDRQHIVTGTEEETNTKMKEWNECMLKDPVVYSLLRCLESIRMHADLNEYVFHQLWPKRSTNTLTKMLQDSFYKKITAKEQFFIFQRDYNWYEFKQCLFLHPELKASQISDSVFEFVPENLQTEVLIDIPLNVYSLLTNSDPDEVQKHTISVKQYLLEYFLPNLSTFNCHSTISMKRDYILKYALENKSAEIGQWLVDNPWIPTTPSGHFKRPSEIIDPNSDIGKLFFESDGYFPTKSFIDPVTIGRLKEYGIVFETLSDDLVIDRAKSIQSSTVCAECALNRCYLLLEYLCKYSTQHTAAMLQLRCIPFLPVMPKPKHWPFVWKADQHQQSASSTIDKYKKHETEPCKHCIFLEPSVLFDKSCANLVGCFWLVFDQNAKHRYYEGMTELLAGIGVRGTHGRLDISIVTTQLLEIAQSFAHCQISNDFDSDGVLNEIYEFLEKSCECQESAAEIAKLLYKKEIVFIDNKFVAPQRVAGHFLDNCSPYLYGLHRSLLVHYRLFCQTIGVKELFDPIDFGMILQTLYHENRDKELTDDILQLSFTLLDCLQKRMELLSISDFREILNNDLQAIYAPDSQCVFRDSTTMCFDDFAPIEKSTNMIYVHDKMSKSVAKTFGVKNKFIKHLDEISESIVDFCQEEPLIERLKRLIESYPLGTVVFKELLQNADDAGATEVIFLKDYNTSVERSSGCDGKVFSSCLYGPSLCVFNNSSFSEKDLDGIKELGRGSKSDDPTNIGRYGVGFNVVYNLTDVPSFLTKGDEIGETLCFFDPNGKYVPETDKKTPGKRYLDLHTIRSHYNSLLRGYHENLFENNKGTMFRFPLRDTENAKTSELSSDSVAPSTITQYLSEFASELPDILIFLKHIKKVRIVTVDGDLNYRVDYSINADMAASDEKRRNAFVLYQTATANVIKSNKHDAFQLPLKIVDYELTLTESRASQSFYSEIKLTLSDNQENHTFKSKIRYLVVQAFGVRKPLDVSTFFTQEYLKGNIRMLPHGGVAVQINKKIDKNFRTAVISGKSKIFCYLPLANEIALPVHIHGHFSLENESRRGLWKSEDVENCFRTLWNLTVIKNIVGPSYVCLLEKMKKHLLGKYTGKPFKFYSLKRRVADYYKLFPEYATAGNFYLNELTKSVYKLLAEDNSEFLPIIKIPISAYHSMFNASHDGELSWTALKFPGSTFPAYCFNNWDTTGHHFLYNLLIDIGMTIVCAPETMQRSMKEADILLENLNTKHVITFLCSFDKDIEDRFRIDLPCDVSDTILSNSSNVTLLFNYCKNDEHFIENIENMPIILTEDGMLTNLKSTPRLFVSKYCDLFEQERHLFVCSTLVDNVTSLMQKILDVYPNKLQTFTIDDAVDIFNRFDAIKLNETVFTVWNEQQPTRKWLRRFWEFFSDCVCSNTQINRKDMFDNNLSKINNLSIIPGFRLSSGEKFLVPVGQISNLMDMTGFPEESAIRHAFEKLDLVTVDFTMFDALEIASEVSDEVPNFLRPVSVIKCLHRNIKRIKEANINEEDANAILTYINERVRSQDVFNLLTYVAQLPIFIAHYGAIVAVSDFVEVHMVPEGFPQAGMKKIGEKFHILFLRDTKLQIFQMLRLNTRSVCKVYTDAIFPYEQYMSRLEFYEHIQYISQKSPRLEPDYKHLIKYLKEVRFVQTANNQHVRIRDLFNPVNKVFKHLCMAEELLPETLRKDELLTLFCLLGLQKDMRVDLFERFAKEISVEGKGSGLTKTIVFKSQLLCKSLWKMAKMSSMFFEESNLKNFAVIPFIIPYKVDTDISTIHQQHQSASLICFSGSVVSQAKYTSWTTLNLLPTFADPYQSCTCRHDTLDVIMSKLNISLHPTFIAFRTHCCKIGTALNAKLRQTPQTIDVQLLCTIFVSIYEEFRRCISNNEVNQEQLLSFSKTPLILYKDQKYLRCPCNVVNSCNDDEEIAPYLERAPVCFGQYQEIFLKLGALNKPCCKAYAKILCAIQQVSKHEPLIPQERDHAMKAMVNLFKYLKRTKKQCPAQLGVDILYLLNHEAKLEDAATLVVSNNQYMRKRLAKCSDICINYLMSLDCFCESGFRLDDLYESLNGLEVKHRPRLLTDVFVERVSVANVEYQDNRYALQLEAFYHSEILIYGISRLLKHVYKSKNIQWRDEMDITLKSYLLKVRCRHVAGIETVLSKKTTNNDTHVMEQVLANTNESKSYYLEVNDNEIIVYFEKTENDWKRKVNETLLIHLNKCFESCLSETTLFLALEILNGMEFPECISEILDRNFIDEYQSINVSTTLAHEWVPKPGTLVPRQLHYLLDNTYGDIYEYDYKFMVYELDNPLLDQVNSDNIEETTATNWTPTYIFVRILRKMDARNDTSLFQNYEIEIGDMCPIIVPAYKLYKLIRNHWPYRSENLEISEYVGQNTSHNLNETSTPNQTLEEVYKNIRRQFMGANDANESKYVFFRLIRCWHPDKNHEYNFDFCTKVSQYINECNERLKQGLPLIDYQADDDVDGNKYRADRNAESDTFRRYWEYNERQRQEDSRRYKEYRPHFGGHSGRFSEFFNERFTQTEQEPYHHYEEANRWQRQAQSDLDNARSSMQTSGTSYNWACYKSHQAAEKSLKAAWFAKDANKMQPIRLSHMLCDIAKGLGGNLEQLAQQMTARTGHHTCMRYPDTGANKIPSDIYSRDCALAVILIAEKIIEHVRCICLEEH